ncbi:MAG: NAD-dependent epimerase/dehydratase family protein [Deltaproteobacteria bacterium]|nr:NAD-dependent epimerase/dehydratase family protein [Deltaproteobacteria bacterium]
MKVLVTGCAGFVGYHVARRLLADGDAVVGLDNLGPYYDPALKRARVAALRAAGPLEFHVGDLAEFELLRALAADVDVVVHLAAQPGVRHALVDPFSYERSNLLGMLDVLEVVRRRTPPPRLVWASSSSVYGGNVRTPFAETDRVDDPVSLYAATKRAGELMVHSYRHLFGLQALGLRFFTVYGPWGRPDMAYWRFAEALFDDRPLELYGDTAASRDMTYIDDVVDGVVAAVRRPVPDELLNLGNAEPIPLERLVETVERAVGRTGRRLSGPAQPGDVATTFADLERSKAALGYEPRVRLEEGIARFVEWYRWWRSVR